MHETHIVFENLSNINRDMLQKAWGLNIGEDGRRISCNHIIIQSFHHREDASKN